MNILLIILASVAGLFVLSIIFWFVYAAVTDKKRTADYAEFSLLFFDDTSKKQLQEIVALYEKDQVKEINKLVEGLDKEFTNSVVDKLHPSRRPPDLSSGKFGDELAWSNWLLRLKEHGYSKEASEIIACCYINSLDKILLEKTTES
jgi:hypothetical protein